MIALTIENILEALNKKGIAATHQKETNQAYLVLTAHKLDFPLFIRAYDEQDLIQFVVFMPCGARKETINDTARLLHMLNKELDIAGFGIDEAASALFYRLSIPIFNKEIDENLLEGFIQSIQGICQTLYPIIQAVATGTISFDEALKQGNKTI